MGDKGNDKSDDDQETKYGDDACKGLVTDMVAWSEKQGKLTPSVLFDELRPLQVTLRFDNSQRMYVVLSVLFKGGDMKAVESWTPCTRWRHSSSRTRPTVESASTPTLARQRDRKVHRGRMWLSCAQCEDRSSSR